MTFSSRWQAWLKLLPLLLLLAFVYWLDQQVQLEVVSAGNSMRHDPDVIMENFSATKMDQLGVPSYLLTASQLRHYPDQDTTELDLPNLVTLEPGHPAMRMQGEHGNIARRGEEVNFRDDVRVVREASGSQSLATLTTRYLRVFPDKGLADTDQPVTMVDERNTVHAVGLELDYKARLLKLLSQVRSEYRPDAK